MAEGGVSKLSNRQRVRLGAAISSRNMESIALGYLDLEPDTLTSLKDAHRDNTEAFNREVLEKWAHMHPGGDQVKNLALLLYEAARDCSYVDPYKVQDILGVSLTEGGFPSRPPTPKPSISPCTQNKPTAVVSPATSTGNKKAVGTGGKSQAAINAEEARRREIASVERAASMLEEKLARVEREQERERERQREREATDRRILELVGDLGVLVDKQYDVIKRTGHR